MPSRIVFLFCLLALSASALADEPGGASVGTPQHGHLVGGAVLPEQGDGWEFRTNRNNPTAHSGTPELVQTITWAVNSVRAQHPGGLLIVMDMSLPEGGELQGHASHASGRDADLRYYALDAQGRPAVAPPELSFGPDGRARDGSALWFDDARNWALVAALLESPWSEVRNIFIHPSLERRLIAFGRRAGAPAQLLALAARRMMPPGGDPRRASPHTDHLHVRIACPADDLDCADGGGSVRSRPAS